MQMQANADIFATDFLKKCFFSIMKIYCDMRNN